MKLKNQKHRIEQIPLDFINKNQCHIIFGNLKYIVLITSYKDLLLAERIGLIKIIRVDRRKKVVILKTINMTCSVGWFGYDSRESINNSLELMSSANFIEGKMSEKCIEYKNENNSEFRLNKLKVLNWHPSIPHNRIVHHQ